jgi:two-component system LytT family response regulator
MLLGIHMAEPSSARFQGRTTPDDQTPLSVVGVTLPDQPVAHFDNKISDRVLKPSSGEGFHEPLPGVPRQTAARRTENIWQVLSPRPMLGRQQLSRIAIKAKGAILFIDSSDVVAIEARGNYLLLLHASGSYMLHESITTAEKKLNRHGFVRIQRSVLINLVFAHDIRSSPTGKYVLRLKGGKEYKVTRSYRKNLQLLAESWIGTDGFVAT